MFTYGNSGNLTKHSITSNGNVQQLPNKHSDCENSSINTCITSSAGTNAQITESTMSNPTNNTGADKGVAHVSRARNRSVRRTQSSKPYCRSISESRERKSPVTKNRLQHEVDPLNSNVDN
jgi:hypothetical protein